MFTAAHRELVTAVVNMRKRAGLTQRQLAEALGREQNLVARIETGQRRVDLVELVQICRACGADPLEAIAAMTKRVAELVPQKRAASGQRVVRKQSRDA